MLDHKVQFVAEDCKQNPLWILALLDKLLQPSIETLKGLEAHQVEDKEASAAVAVVEFVETAVDFLAHCIPDFKVNFLMCFRQFFDCVSVIDDDSVFSAQMKLIFDVPVDH